MSWVMEQQTAVGEKRRGDDRTQQEPHFKSLALPIYPWHLLSRTFTTFFSA